MAGTKIGGQRAAETNRAKYGEDYYKTIGTQGGKAEYEGKRGFAADIKRAREAGRKGGAISRRGKTKVVSE